MTMPATSPAAAPDPIPPLAATLATWIGRVCAGSGPEAPGPAGAPDRAGWLGAALPFAFVYGGRPSADLLPSWERTASLPAPPEGAVAGPGAPATGSVSLRDPQTGLVVTWEATLYPDTPAVTWLLTFRNEGPRDTPILERVRALHLRAATDPYDLAVYYATGGHATPDAFAPRVHCLRSEPPGPFRLASIGGRSSNGVLPYFAVETNAGGADGLVVGVGWSGQWEALIERERSAPPPDVEPDLRGPNGQVSAFRSLDRLRLEAGMEGVHLALRPGELIRSPRILLIPWEGDRRRGQNALRRFLHRHVAPREVVAGEGAGAGAGAGRGGAPAPAGDVVQPGHRRPRRGDPRRRLHPRGARRRRGAAPR